MLIARVEKVRVRLLRATTHASPELVELREPELSGAIDNDRVYVGDVEARFDDRRADEDVVLRIGELDHHPLQFAFVHLTVRHDVAGLGDELPQPMRLLLDALHAVVHVVDLAASVHLAQDRLTQDVVASFDDVRLDRLPVLGRRFDDADIAHAREGHVQGARDRGGGQREHVDFGAHLLEPLLVLHPEAVLLVDHHEAEVAEAHVPLQDAMRADDDVGLTGPERIDDGALLRGRAEAREHRDANREGREALGERLVVLLREHGRRHDDRDLLSVHHRFERRAERDLGLPVAHVADDQPVHRSRPLHVALGVLDRLELIGRLRIGEGVLHLDLPRRILREREPRARLAQRIKAQQLARDLLDGSLGLSLRREPIATAQRRKGRRRSADVACHPVDALGRQGDHIGSCESQLEILAHDAGDLARDEALKTRDAVILVHHVVARL